MGVPVYMLLHDADGAERGNFCVAQADVVPQNRVGVLAERRRRRPDRPWCR